MHRTLLSFVVQGLLVGQALCAYDYVVVGGGNGGLVVASRLSEDPDVKVLVLEAGPQVENLPEVFIPGMIGGGESFRSLNWAYHTVPQEHMNGRQLTVNAGRALGGSTIINSMIASRATRAEYDAIGILNNSTEWTWDALLPFFRQSEVFTPPNDYQSANGARYDPSVHGPSTPGNPDQGAVKVGFPNYFFPQSELFARAMMNNGSMGLGYQRSQDVADGLILRQVGVSCNTLDAAENTRCSAACGYIMPFLDRRSNLQVITNATVSKILWDERKRKAGSLVAKKVEYYVDGDETPKYADVNTDKGGEVVLAAGTIGTPKVMELSGVGGSSLLTGLGIDVVLDLPSVGENLADHIHTWTSSTTNASITKDVLLQNETFKAEQLKLWYDDKSGLYSAAPRTLSIAAPTDLLSKDRITSLINDAKRDIDKYASEYANGNSDLEKGIKAQHEIALDLYEKDKQGVVELNVEPGYSGPTPADQRGNRNFTTISAVFYSPLARGRTHVTSTDHTARPAVDPAYWAHPVDVAMLVGGVQTARKILRTPPLQTIFVEEFEPGAEVGESDEAVEAYLRTVAGSDNHEVGTMAMMPKGLGGVVDTRLKVYGLDNVRVTDASILAMPLSTHMESTVYMIGEKAAELIKRDRRPSNDASSIRQTGFKL